MLSERERSSLIAAESIPSSQLTFTNTAAKCRQLTDCVDKVGMLLKGSKTGSRVTGVGYNQYAGFQTYNSNEQKLVVQMTPPERLLRLMSALAHAACACPAVSRSGIADDTSSRRADRQLF